MFKYSLVAVAAAILSCPALAQDAASQEGQSGVGIIGAWVRALPPTVKNTAAYMTIINESGSAQAVVSARSPVAAKVEVHTTMKVEGLMRMQKLPGLAVADGEAVSLAPGGVHLMLFDLAYSLAPGDEVELCLMLATGQESCTTAEVKRDAGGAHQHH
ncbi:MAG: copper(I)-binding protein [Bacteroidia bacterium]